MTLINTLETILHDGYILVFNQDKLDIVRTAEALRAIGVNNMEVTCRIAQPLQAIRQLRDALPDFVIGAASLIDAPDMLAAYNAANPTDTLPSVAEVVDAGVDYIVSAANFRPETFQQFGRTVAMMPGCGTVSEILTQFACGANLVKAFPAKQLGGPAFIKAVDAPLHKVVPLVPTGGTTLENIPDYIAAGVLAVGGSFSGVGKDVLTHVIDEQDYDLLASRLGGIKHVIDNARTSRWPEIDLTTAPLAEISQATGRLFNAG